MTSQEFHGICMLAVNPPRPVKRPEDFPSFSRPQPLSLRLENGLLQHRTRVRAPQCHRKKPRLGFFRLSNETHPANRRQPAQPRRKNGPTATKSASGIPYWPSRDPIGERGGKNLYDFVGNDGVDRRDFLGLSQLWPWSGLDLNPFQAIYHAGFDLGVAVSGPSQPEEPLDLWAE